MEPPNFSFAVTAYVDGESIRSHAFKKPSASYFVDFDSFITSEVTERKLLFKAMKLTGGSFFSSGIF